MNYAESLERLRKFQKRPHTVVPKVPKPPFGTFGTALPGRFQKNEAHDEELKEVDSRDGTEGPWTSVEVDEAVEERAAIMEEAGTNATTAEQLGKRAREFYNHLFGEAKRTGCCHAPVGRYCAEGERLRDLYYRAAADVDVVPFERHSRHDP